MRIPYVTGSYVTGNQHYGREDLLDYLLNGESRACWVVGTRRIGKTSLLRQLELLATTGGRLVPLYWDMQGCNSFACLGRYLADALRDRAAIFEPLGVTQALMDEEDPLALLVNLRRLATRAGRELLLLCDETEVLINIAVAEPEAMQRLHRQLTAGVGLRTVMTSTRQIYQMHDVCHDWPTSPFLSGFDMSLTLGSLEPEAARGLILQTQSNWQVEATPETVEAISQATNNHPFLIQVLCSRLFITSGKLRDLTPEDLQVDPMLAGFFEHDFRQLTNAERRTVLAIHREKLTDEASLRQITGDNPAELSLRLHNLEALGYLRRAHGRIEIGNDFLAKWLSTADEQFDAMPFAKTSETAARRAFVRQQLQDIPSLVAQLNARRARLVELELTRARELLNISPEVLAEIELIQNEIAALRAVLARRSTTSSIPE
ncbi:MAG: hypothetical protein ACUVR4_10610 [Anaerolineae bacterium]